MQNLPGQTGILFIISLEGVKLYKKPLRVFCLTTQDLGNFELIEEGIFSLISIASLQRPLLALGGRYEFLVLMLG